MRREQSQDISQPHGSYTDCARRSRSSVAEAPTGRRMAPLRRSRHGDFDTKAAACCATRPVRAAPPPHAGVDERPEPADTVVPGFRIRTGDEERQLGRDRRLGPVLHCHIPSTGRTLHSLGQPLQHTGCDGTRLAASEGAAYNGALDDATAGRPARPDLPRRGRTCMSVVYPEDLLCLATLPKPAGAAEWCDFFAGTCGVPEAGPRRRSDEPCDVRRAAASLLRRHAAERYPRRPSTTLLSQRQTSRMPGVPGSAAAVAASRPVASTPADAGRRLRPSRTWLARRPLAALGLAVGVIAIGGAVALLRPRQAKPQVSGTGATVQPSPAVVATLAPTVAATQAPVSATPTPEPTVASPSRYGSGRDTECHALHRAAG